LVTPSLKSAAAAASLGGGMAAGAVVFGGLQTECEEKSV